MKPNHYFYAALGILLSTPLFGLGTQPATAQSAQPSLSCADSVMRTDDPAAAITALSRAKHLARQAAEAANGGLEVYRTEAAMHGPVSEAPCTVSGNGIWTFDIKGGEPAFEVPTKQTIVTVDSTTWDVRIDYNGPIR